MIKWFNSPTLWVGKKKIHLIPRGSASGLFIHALEKIPPQYAEAFRMSRIETLNYQEISQKLGISVRTVEVRISKALSLLREELKDFLLIVILYFQLFH